MARPRADWLEGPKHACDRAQRPQPEVELAVGHPKARFAGQLDGLKGLTLEVWNRKLDEQVKQAVTPTAHE